MSKKIVLFDVDGTLTVPRKKAPEHIHQLLAELRKVVTIGIVGGSDLSKIKEQLGDNVLDTVDYTFSENGLVAHKGKEKLAVQSIKTFLGEDDLKRFINFVLKYVADLDIPVKRGTFIEFRNGMLNVSPIGRNCSQEERDAFEQFDNGAHVRPPELWTTIDMIELVEWLQYCEYCEVMKRQIRVCKMPGKKMVEVLKAEFAALGLTYSIGGQISFDVFPTGWDKTYCLQFVETEFDEIHFFGDKTYQGGNDYEIYESDMTIGHHTTGPEDTIKQCKELFFS